MTISLYIVPGTGIEPVRIAPQVFETSASTNSAIRARCSYRMFRKDTKNLLCLHRLLGNPFTLRHYTTESVPKKSK